MAKVDGVTIYDGDDPDMAMWMKFSMTNGYGSYLGRTAATVTSVHMLNGNLCVGRGNSGYGEALLRANFISEHSVNYAVSGWRQIQPIAGRDLDATSNVELNYAGINAIINIAINDVAMTVLPNAPIDPDTGLPVPTIAVATASGVSVIKDNGSVVDITVNNASYTIARRVNFLSDNSLGMGIGVANGVAQESYYVFNNIPTSDNVITVDNIAGTVQNVDEFYGIQPPNALIDLQLLGLDTNRRLLSSTGNIFASDEGLSVISRNVGAPDKGLISYIASDYNTGWMNGDIKLATLSDTDTTNVTGSELVDQTASGWTLPTGFSHNGSGTLTAASNTGQYQKAYDAITSFVVGKVYTVTFNVTAKSGSMSFWINDSTSYSGNWTGTNEIAGTGIKSHTFTASDTTGYVVFQCNTLGNTITVSDISVRLAEEDRSFNNNGVQVFGTVTKTAVATGAELVGYSGFSTSNFLRKPYHSGLDLGTGDFVFSIWCKLTAASSQYDFLWEPQTADSGQRFYILRNISTGNLYLPYNTNIPNTFIPIGIWTKVDIVRRNNIASQYINGKKAGINYASNHNLDASSSSGNYRYTHIGCYTEGSFAWNGSIALARISATAPTPEQIAKMYNDEKQLFATNAKATLYGTSDAVTALAHDDDTELLHVGTSAGRSVFQGLNRVDNTTDAVGAAISASNGLVAED